LAPPSFIKIDVGGNEFEVLSGLSRPINYIFIEFAAENIHNTYKCINYVDSLSRAEYQVSKGETMEFVLPSWVSKQEILQGFGTYSFKGKIRLGRCLYALSKR